ncbi:HlyD family secretion protein [Nitratiruptor sp. SB155-2]|uniref:HlyD family secretion protein n=1 Tax=Nitratiruptor sp. (strain SB155-2) TaxID=387092 RepID=UPI0001587033|nr:HlyD family efflux transporter periplasmic adaptor subunit [Nitratiruptor sp. SB155-2]BAF70827.1 multidrug-efflux transporter, MFS family [Nitratiruptor sp. SB155-2]
MKRVGTALLILLIILFWYVAYRYVHFRTQNAVSDAAFLRTDSLLTLSFKVGGKVVKMAKKEGEDVQKNELLALIDDRDFVIEKKRLQSQIDSLKQKSEALRIKKEKLAHDIAIQREILDNTRKKLKKDIEAFGYEIAADKAKLKQTTRDLRRYRSLYQRHLIQKEKLEKIETQKDMLEDGIRAKTAKLMALKVDLANIDQKEALLQNSLQSIKELSKEIASLQKRVEALQASKKEIENKIEYCRLYAPIEGRIAKKYINIQRVVKKGSPVYSIVDPKDLHVEVLLSEKKLHGVVPGNPVEIWVDAFKDRKYHGKVESILPASAATFSLVPRDIASGEFTKLDQRFVVRISLENPTPDLKVGMGAEVAIKRR